MKAQLNLNLPFMKGKKMFLVAARNIRKGEEITDNYCIHFSDMPVSERKGWIEVTSICFIQYSKILHVVFLGKLQV